MSTNKKLKAFIVLAYREDDRCAVVDLYASRAAARACVIRLEEKYIEAKGVTFHIIKKAVHGVLHAFTLKQDKKEFYKVYLNN